MQSWVLKIPREKISQLHHSKEFVKEVNASIVRQTPVIPGDFYILRRSSHSEPRLTKSASSTFVMGISRSKGFPTCQRQSRAWRSGTQLTGSRGLCVLLPKANC